LKKNDQVDAGEIAQGQVDPARHRHRGVDGTAGRVEDARGYAGASGQEDPNLSVWLAFFAAFLLSPFVTSSDGRCP